jgi:hypothetical protein
VCALIACAAIVVSLSVELFIERVSTATCALNMYIKTFFDNICLCRFFNRVACEQAKNCAMDEAVAKIRDWVKSTCPDAGSEESEWKVAILEDVLFAQCGLDPLEPNFDLKKHDAQHKKPPVVDTKPPPFGGVCDSPKQFARRFARTAGAVSTTGTTGGVSTGVARVTVPATTARVCRAESKEREQADSGAGECVVHFCRVRRADQPSNYGWSWNKKGPYVGDFNLKRTHIENLFDANGRHGRPLIAEQYLFSLTGTFADDDFEHFRALEAYLKDKRSGNPGGLASVVLGKELLQSLESEKKKLPPVAGPFLCLVSYHEDVCVKLCCFSVTKVVLFTCISRFSL